MITLNSCNKEFNIEIPELDQYLWRQYIQELEDKGLVQCLNSCIKLLDCSIIYSSGRPMSIYYPIYDKAISKYYWLLLKIEDPVIYNFYLDLLIDTHEGNITFEQTYKPISHEKVKEAVKKSRLENKYYRRETKDLFTNETIYIYDNPKTNHTIKSTRHDLLDELNAPKRKEKRNRDIIPLSSMTFKF
jgi:hypothetical protein